MRKFHFQQLLVKEVMNNKQFAVKDEDFKMSIWTGKHIHCVEVAIKPEGVAIRDSIDPTKNTLYFSRGDWDAFIKGVKDGQFDL